MKAFKCTDIWTGACYIIFAETSSKARHKMVVEGNGAGFNIEYKDIAVKRAPDFDSLLGTFDMLGYDDATKRIESAETGRNTRYAGR